MNTTSESFPPRPHLALRVGVTGHRLDKLPKSPEDLARLRTVVRTTLDTFVVQPLQRIAQTPNSGYFSSVPRLIIVSPLAEGADRLVAQEAISLGFELQAVLPFSQVEYERDFEAPGSAEEFRGLIKQATAVMQLDGTRSQSKQAYERVGRSVFAHADVLLAIWDGEEPELRGGTAQIVTEARAENCPVLWVQSKAPHEIKLLAGSAQMDVPTERFEKLLREQLLVADPVQAEHLVRYFAEQQKRYTFGGIFKAFCKFLSAWEFSIKIRVDPFLSETKREWNNVWEGADLNAHETYRDQTVPQIEGCFLAHYAWADKLANYYGNLYRSSFLVTFTLSVLAVFLGALSPLFENGRRLLILEAICIALYTGITYWAKSKGDWQHRWLDYRLLAEYLRHMRFLWALGLKGSSIQAPAHHGDGDPRNTWVTWLCYAIKRDAGLVHGSQDRGLLRSHAKLLRYEVQKQIAYHENTAKDYAKILWWGQVIGYLPIGSAVGAWLFGMIAIQVEWDNYLAMVGAVIPAAGAAFAAIMSQGEFNRVEVRSKQMAARLREYVDGIDSERELSYDQLSELAEDIALTMMSELVDWRVVFLRKPLALP